MNKQLLRLTFLTFFMSGIFASCTKIDTTINLDKNTKLSEDKAFIDLTVETYEYLIFIANQTTTKNLSFSILNKKLSELQNKNLPFLDQMVNIDLIFKGNVSERLYQHMKVYKKNWLDIRSRYTNLNRDVLERECAEVLAKKFGKELNNENQNLLEPSGGCGWRYYLCSGAATAGAVLCHAACDTTALATTAGLGIPVCVLACGTLQAFAMVQCSDNYCPTNLI